MEINLNQKIHDMKKVILHLHLDGSLRPETVREWLQEDGENVSLEEVKKGLTFYPVSTMEEVLKIVF